MGSQGLISALVQALLLAPVPDLDAAGLARHSLTAARRTLDPEGVWGKFARDLYGAFSVKRLFWVCCQFFVRSGKAVLRPVACDQVRGARGRGQGTETLAELGGLPPSVACVSQRLEA